MPTVFEPPGDPVPLCWVRAVEDDARPYVNVGDALSPFLLAMVSGRVAVHAAFDSPRPRMAAIGTIGQNLRAGPVEIWGTGCSPWADPLGPGRAPYAPPPGLALRLHATRGPMSARLLSGGGAPAVPYGDPAALLPRFHAAPVATRWEIGAVLHLSELADRGFEAVAKPGTARYRTEGDPAIRLITMVAPPTPEAIRDKIDEIRACRRIVSTSLHGYAIAAAYGIPCLYLGADAGPDGMAEAALDAPEAERVNARFVDLLLGCGRRRIAYWRQRKSRPLDWAALAQAVDAHGEPPAPDGDALLAACPAGAAPIAPPPGGTVWDHPLIRATPIRAPEPPVATPGPPARAAARARALFSGRGR